jgi:hypothetical protein
MIRAFFIQASRLTGPLLIGIPVSTFPVLFHFGADPTIVAAVHGLWCFVVGYIYRGWMDYLRSIGEV